MASTMELEAHGREQGLAARGSRKAPSRRPTGPVGPLDGEPLRHPLWLLIVGAFGFFAVRVEHALAGAGWQDSTSQSVKARDIVQRTSLAWARRPSRW